MKRPEMIPDTRRIPFDELRRRYPRIALLRVVYLVGEVGVMLGILVAALAADLHGMRSVANALALIDLMFIFALAMRGHGRV